MRILEVIPNFVNGGAERLVCELSNSFVNYANVQCEILTLYAPDNKDGLLSSIDRLIKVSSLNKKSGFDISIFFKLFKFIKNNNIDVVHVHVGAIKYILLASILLPKVKFIATIHSEAQREAGRSIDKLSRIFLFKNKFCEPVTISKESEQSFYEFYGIHAEIVTNGVSLYKEGNQKICLNKKDSELLFIHPASCQIIKNQELLFSSFSRLSKECKNIKLLWFGNVSSFHDLYTKLSIYFSESIEYCGVIDNVRDYLKEADAMCLSSTMEGMPMTIIESFSVGCIPLCTPVGGCKNLIEDGVNGLLSAGLDEDNYYFMLKRFVAMTNDDRQQMKIEAYESYKKYTISKTTDAYLSLIRRL